MLPINEGQSGNIVSCEDGRGDLQPERGKELDFPLAFLEGVHIG